MMKDMHTTYILYTMHTPRDKSDTKIEYEPGFSSMFDRLF